ncbi:wax synthase family protein [Aspergillus neoniger CBS 115656]|uniref:Wax synthase domain-containing protein n=1 Tax=Aspergillus neoniger (strain CBS 115656) TaxID=1448310 RepID=A0A318YIB1_ASPNB|nr:hypothetical protein BO87DRAFT_387259 [Aspergillus neoniger CBS 115656]PYH33834.1 hypothetical protein BO87DRAFT_387259 [Aspergillus neoniger CBS 115656]
MLSTANWHTAIAVLTQARYIPTGYSPGIYWIMLLFQFHSADRIFLSLDLAIGRMAASQPPFSYRRLIHDNEAQFESLIQNGQVKPVLLWHLTLPLVLSILALLIPHHRGGRYVRPLVLACIIGITGNVLQHRRMLTGGNGYMAGLIPVWSTIWAATILLFRNVERDFKRLERRPLSISSTAAVPNGVAANGHAKEPKCIDITNDSSTESVIWQPYPRNLSHRINWVISVATSMRGPEWNWRISSMGVLPASVQAQLNNSSEHHEEKANKTTPPKPITMRARLRTTFILFLQSYLLLDLIKLLMIRDQYFMGSVSPPAPPPFPFHYLTPYPLLIHIYRCLVTATGVFAALNYVTCLNPLIFGGLSLAFPNAAKSFTSVPLSAPYLYPPAFGPFLTPILDHSLAGCWSLWWHQLFRYGFVSAAHWFLSLLPSRLSSSRPVRRTLTALVAFSLSGLVHASGSYVQNRVTYPIAGPFRFFILQAVGVLVQGVVSPLWLWMPRPVRRACNALFAVTWLFGTAGPLVEDFSRGGLWFTEPLPSM